MAGQGVSPVERHLRKPDTENEWMIRVRQLLYATRSSFWFTPGLIVLGMIVLACGMIALEGVLSTEFMKQSPLLFAAGASGSRELLSAVASSMITVAGVVFSITLVVLSLTASQYSPRVLRNFMRDSVNQSVLGVFLGIYAYCLVVLRTIYESDENTFVPTLAVLGGLLLGFTGLAYLIFFIHHIAVSIQASQILADVSHETLSVIDQTFPEPVEAEDSPTEEVPVQFGKSWRPLRANRSGFLQTIQTKRLVHQAQKQDFVLRLKHALGDFLVDGAILGEVLSVAPLDESAEDTVRDCFAVGRERTFEQDVAYGLRQSVDIALKALSPGINDVTTAMTAIHYLTVVMTRVSQRHIETVFCDDQHEPRLRTPGPSFERLLTLAFAEIRHNAAGNLTVLRQLLESLQTIAELNSLPSRRAVIAAELELLHQSISDTLPDNRERDALLEQSAELRKELKASG